MLHEITGAQLGFLLEVQNAWVRETIAIHSRWKLGKAVKQRLHILLGPAAQAQTFVCQHCGRPAPAVAPGARQRSHCPHCLWSLHTRVAATSGATDCRGQMEPVAVSMQSGGAWSLLHRCRQCATTHVHSIAVDDNGAALLSIATRPAAKPAAVPKRDIAATAGA